VHCAIRERVMFSDVPNETLERALVTIDDLTYPPQAVLYQTGEKGDSLFTIRRGVVKLVHYLPNGSQRIVRILKPGDVGGIELTTDKTYHHTAIAMQEAKVCRIPLAVIEFLRMEHPHLCHQLELRLQRSLDDADRFIFDLATGSAEARVARLLLYMQDVPGCENRCVTVGREDMGAMLGITMETASRVMADFKRRSIISELPAANQCYCDVDMLRILAQDL
jgi:CRP/FNR family transcriptional regulator, anaerobic regulatory protein